MRTLQQLVLDCWNAGDWGGIRGYPVKFAIGFVSVFFDIIFLFQVNFNFVFTTSISAELSGALLSIL